VEASLRPAVTDFDGAPKSIVMTIAGVGAISTSP
jgi:hypothetical protein